MSTSTVSTSSVPSLVLQKDEQYRSLMQAQAMFELDPSNDRMKEPQFAYWKSLHQRVRGIFQSSFCQREVSGSIQEDPHYLYSLLSLQFGGLARVTSIAHSKLSTEAERKKDPKAIQHLNIAPIYLNKDPFSERNGYYRSDFSKHKLTVFATDCITGFVWEKKPDFQQGKVKACLIQSGAWEVFQNIQILVKKKAYKVVFGSAPSLTNNTLTFQREQITTDIPGEFNVFDVVLFPEEAEAIVTKFMGLGAAPPLEKICATCALFLRWHSRSNEKTISLLLPQIFRDTRSASIPKSQLKQPGLKVEQPGLKYVQESSGAMKKSIDDLCKSMCEKQKQCALEKDFILNCCQLIDEHLEQFDQQNTVGKLNYLDEMASEMKAIVSLNYSQQYNFDEIERRGWIALLKSDLLELIEKCNVGNIFTSSGMYSLALVLYAQRCVKDKSVYKELSGAYFEYRELIEAMHGFRQGSVEECPDIWLGEICPSINNKLSKKDDVYEKLKPEDVCKVLEKRDSEQPCTIVLDITCGGRQDAIPFLQKLAEYIQKGLVNVVLIWSAQKFGMDGADNCTGGVVSVFNNSAKHWERFNDAIKEKAITSGVSHDMLSVRRQAIIERTDGYQGMIAKNTQKLYGKIIENIELARLVQQSNVLNKVFLQLRLSLQVQEAEQNKKARKERSDLPVTDQERRVDDFVEAIYSLAIKMVLVSRGSFGFPMSSIKYFPPAKDEKALQMRLTIGVEDDTDGLISLLSSLNLPPEQPLLEGSKGATETVGSPPSSFRKSFSSQGKSTQTGTQARAPASATETAGSQPSGLRKPFPSKEGRTQMGTPARTPASTITPDAVPADVKESPTFGVSNGEKKGLCTISRPPQKVQETDK